MPHEDTPVAGHGQPHRAAAVPQGSPEPRLLDSSPGGGRSEVNLRSQSAGWGQDRASDGDPGQTQLREAMQVPSDEAEPRPGRESAAQGQRAPGLSLWAWAHWWEHCRHAASGPHAGTEGPGLIRTAPLGRAGGQGLRRALWARWCPQAPRTASRAGAITAWAMASLGEAQCPPPAVSSAPGVLSKGRRPLLPHIQILGKQRWRV